MGSRRRVVMYAPSVSQPPHSARLASLEVASRGVNENSRCHLEPEQGFLTYSRTRQSETFLVAYPARTLVLLNPLIGLVEDVAAAAIVLTSHTLNDIPTKGPMHRTL